MAAPDAVARLTATLLEGEARSIWKVYFHKQQHSSLAAFMSHVLKLDDAHIAKKRQDGLLIQVSLKFVALKGDIVCCFVLPSNLFNYYY